MSPEIQQALIGGGYAIVGAFLGSGFVSYMIGIMADKRKADVATYISAKKLFSDNALTHLKDADFYVGVPQWVVSPIRHLVEINQNKNSFHFHDKKISDALNRLVSVAQEFSSDVALRTTPEGQYPHRLITTVPIRSRVKDQEKQRYQQESEELVDVTKRLHDAAIEFDNVALTRLRLSPADSPSPMPEELI